MGAHRRSGVSPTWLRSEPRLDAGLQQFDDVRVVDDVDATLAVALIAAQAGELELDEVVADGGQALAGLLGERADVASLLGEQPQQMHPDWGREHGERRGHVLQYLSVQR